MVLAYRAMRGLGLPVIHDNWNINSTLGVYIMRRSVAAIYTPKKERHFSLSLYHQLR